MAEGEGLLTDRPGATFIRMKSVTRCLTVTGLVLALLQPLAADSGSPVPQMTAASNTNAPPGSQDAVFPGSALLLETIRNAVRAGEYGKAHDAYTELRKRNQEREVPAALVLSLLYHAGKTAEARDWLKNNPDLLTRPGAHRYAVALLYYEEGEFGLFFLHLVASFEDEAHARQRGLREIVLAIHNRQFSRALRLLDQPGNSGATGLLRDLRAYVYLLQGDTENGYSELKKNWAADTSLELPKLQLLFQLALKNKSGKESAYWGEQVLKNHPDQLKNPVFLNNLCMALARQLKELSTPAEKDALRPRLMQYTSDLLRVRRDAGALHTASFAYEQAGDIAKAVEMIRLCRSLAPDEKEYLEMQKRLESQLRDLLRKTGGGN